MGEDFNFGNKLKDLVQDALNSENFKGLNKNVEDIVKGALNEARNSMNWDKVNNNNKKKQNNNINYKNTINKPKKIGPIVSTGRLSGILLTVFGAIGTGIFGIVVFFLMFLGYGLKIEAILGNIGIGFTPFLVASIISLYSGVSINGRLKRSQKYVVRMKGREYAAISDLILQDSSSKKTIKDLKKMIKVGIFPQGHIDDSGKYFIINNKTYEEYLQLQEGIKLRKIEEEEIRNKIRNENKSRENLNPDIKNTINYGRDFINRIKDANVKLPGEEISNKLDRLEGVTKEIFDYVEVHPEKYSEIKKFSEYFLPTTLKLVEAYMKLDDQPIEGENILNAKREIEESMDTINHAFENLLDSLFEDLAMDVSTDISVLETILAQEGLTNKDMKMNNK